MTYKADQVWAKDSLDLLKPSDDNFNDGFEARQTFPHQEANYLFNAWTHNLKLIKDRVAVFEMVFHRGRGVGFPAVNITSNGVDLVSKDGRTTNASSAFYRPSSTGLYFRHGPRGDYDTDAIDPKLPFDYKSATRRRQLLSANSDLFTSFMHNPVSRIMEYAGATRTNKDRDILFHADSLTTLNEWWERMEGAGPKGEEFRREYDSSSDKYFQNELISSATIVERIPFRSDFVINAFKILIGNVFTTWGNLFFIDRADNQITGFKTYRDKDKEFSSVVPYGTTNDVYSGIEIRSSPFATPFHMGFRTWLHRFVTDPATRTGSFHNVSDSRAFVANNGRDIMLFDLNEMRTRGINVPTSDSVWSTYFTMLIFQDMPTI